MFLSTVGSILGASRKWIARETVLSTFFPHQVSVGFKYLYTCSHFQHKQGHIAALVRTQTCPDVFHLLAGDVGHHISLIDPESPTRIAVYPKKENPLNLDVHGKAREELESIGDDIGKTFLR